MTVQGWQSPQIKLQSETSSPQGGHFKKQVLCLATLCDGSAGPFDLEPLATDQQIYDMVMQELYQGGDFSGRFLDSESKPYERG